MTTTLPPGATHIGRYRIDSRLGRGGMGEVYKAFDPALQRFVALKVLLPELVTRADRVERFVREARSASALNHPNIVTVYEIGEDPVRYISMELVEGTTLRKEIYAEGTTPKALLGLLLQVCGGLAKAHDAGIVHRDLKPDNIMITTDGHAKILDFGLAKLIERPSGQPSDVSTDFRTREGMVLGTVGYMAPEQIEGKASDHRCDIFAFGCVLYEALTRHRPFEAASEVDTLHKVLHADPPPPQRFANVPVTANRAIERCLAKNPDERYQTMKNVYADLEALEKVIGDTASRAPATKWVVVAAGAAMLAIALGLFINRAAESTSAALPAAYQSIAVLPLANLSGDPTQEYFVDGMHEALIADMAQIRALRVISRTSVMGYKKNPKPIREIARELNVDAVVEGSVTRSGDRVRVTAQLIDAKQDRHLWAKTYERSISSILSLQGEVASAIASEIRVTLTPQERTKLSQARAVRPEAYEAFLKGQFLLRSPPSAPSLQKSLQYFNEAITLDPSYAAAWAYLGMTYNQMALFGHITPADAASHAKPVIARALEIDRDQPDAHVALATLLFRYDLDWNEAEREYRRAIELNPGDANARNLFSVYLTGIGRYDEALAEGRRHDDLNPVAGDRLLGWLHLRAGRYDQAIDHYKKALELDSTFHWPRANLAVAYTFKDQADSGAEECDKIPQEARDAPIRGMCTWVYVAAGRHSDARTLMKQLLNPGVSYIDPWFIAVAQAAMGDREQVLRSIEKAYAERSPNLWGITGDTHRRQFRFVSNEPRYQAVLGNVYPSGLRGEKTAN